MWNDYLFEDQSERLDLLVEEASEIIQIAQKIKRFGFESCNPNDPDSLTNRNLLEQEIGDFMLVMGMMVEGGEIDIERLIEASKRKLVKMSRFTRHQSDILNSLQNHNEGEN